ncbi:MAG: PLP-dependent aminotransferase family protein [Chloroflexi bacterium]|nr:PLP-dependent aminotransferase family protein [Chloroflexota bacterium]MDA1004175.1 PLP-dependent aminotransferase family protein [Chloroflexota bacterium]
MTVDSASDLTDELGRLWAEYDLDSLTSEAAQYLSAGTATDWGLSAVVDYAVPTISLGGGIPDPASLPREELLDAMQRALAPADDGPLRYGGAVGFEPLRVALADRYTRDRGRPVTPAHFLLTNGSAGAIDLVCSAFLSPGDVVIAEAPSFSGSLRTFRGHQTEVVTVSMDHQGMHTEELEQTVERLVAEGRRVKLIYTIANFHNPMGAAMSLSRREHLLRIAARHGILILDDDAYGDIYFGEAAPRALSALSGGHGVITAGTFSKMIATGLRVGWIHAEPALIERCTRMRFEMGNSPLLHRMIYEFMKDGTLDRHLEKMRSLYAEKLDILASAMHEYCEPYLSFKKPAGGFFLWVTLRDGLTADALQAAGLEEGISFPIGYAFFPNRIDTTGEHIRLAFSWTSKDDLREGARRLGRACERAIERVSGGH